MQKDISILIGGKAGYGIDKASFVIAGIINQSGWRLYIYRDYPSLIRGGHTFSIIRASASKIAAHREEIDILLALDQPTLDLHKKRLKKDSIMLYDSDLVKVEGAAASGARSFGIPLSKIIKEEGASEIMRNSCIIGALCKTIGVGWSVAERVLKDNFSKEIDINLKVALRGYNEAREVFKLETLKNNILPLITGNEAIGQGLIKGGLKAYIAYPMTPSSGILHYLAEVAGDRSLKVIHPESEIAVMLMALGFSYCGDRVAVGTSGGGFCLMTEGLSLSGMAELPVAIILSQRPGPSTGLPTYTSQTELQFALSAGQGEFTRFIAAPGDAEEAYYWSRAALNISWKYQIPSFILTDKTLNEGTFSFDPNSIKPEAVNGAASWDRKGEYKRYLDTQDGVSPLAFAPDKDAVIKVNSYEHDEYGITTEDPVLTKKMQEKRLRKALRLAEELEGYETVKVYGDNNSATALLCWGSNKGVCIEAAEALGLKVIQPIALSPFPLKAFQNALAGVKKVISVENNATGQLEGLINRYGFKADGRILKYDGRPFSLDELLDRLKAVKL